MESSEGEGLQLTEGVHWPLRQDKGASIELVPVGKKGFIGENIRAKVNNPPVLEQECPVDGINLEIANRDPREGLIIEIYCKNAYKWCNQALSGYGNINISFSDSQVILGKTANTGCKV